tara:strand:- start:34163 stop:34402 length:240 start_codon:yes stop_codon:yes gene_type:complete
MKTRLIKNLSKDEAGEMKEYFLQSLYFRKRLITVIDEEVESLHNSMLNEEDYTSPNWSLLQVEKLAQIKSMKKIKSFLE